MTTELDTENKTCAHCTKAIPSTEPWAMSYRIENDKRVDEKYYCLKCDLQLRVREYKKDRIITSKLYLDASLLVNMHNDDPVPKWAARIAIDMKGIECLEREWEMAVWFGGALPKSKTVGSKHYSYQVVDVPTPGSLQEFVLKALYKGYSATVGDINYHSYTICGRSMFQIEQGDHHVNLILDETSPELRGGIQGIYATVEVAEKLIRQAIKDWKSGAIKLEQSKVGML